MKLMVAWVLVLALAVPAGAHRLDEYLQATRFGVGLDRIDLAIDLTPGVSIVQDLLGVIGTPIHSSVISAREQARYSRQVLRNLNLELDGRRQSIRLQQLEFPTLASMELGEGVIRLKAFVKIPKLKPGHHQITYRNDHLPSISIYQVNALVPESKAVKIVHQARDEGQKNYRLDLEVQANEEPSPLPPRGAPPAD